MKNKWFVGLCVLLIGGFVLAGCDTGGGGGGGGDNNNPPLPSSGTVPAALQGNWLRDTDTTEQYLVFITNAFTSSSTSFANAKRDAEGFARSGDVVTSVTADKIEYKAGGETKSINYAIANGKLTLSGNNTTYYGTYTKQP